MRGPIWWHMARIKRYQNNKEFHTSSQKAALKKKYIRYVDDSPIFFLIITMIRMPEQLQ